MNVKLVSITQSLVEGQNLTAEELLVYIARVSNPSNQLNTATSDKLISYMIRNKHWSPFDMVNMTVEVTTSRAIAQQILRHWSIKPQEFSQRYAEAVDFEPVELRKQGATNRQSSEEVFDPMLEYGDLASESIAAHIQGGEILYKDLLGAGVAKECARMVLPLTTSTTMYLNGSVRSWIHYIEQRTDLHAQLEHREVANLILDIFKEQFPNVFKALEDNKLNSRSSIQLVEEFHKTFGHPIGECMLVPDWDIVEFRTNFIREELKELEAAVADYSVVELADALGDIQYVLDGFFLNAGLHTHKDAIMAEIHRSNMTKVCRDEKHANETISYLKEQDATMEYHYGQVAKYWVVYRSHDRKVMKALGYEKPNLAKVLGYGEE